MRPHFHIATFLAFVLSAVCCVSAPAAEATHTFAIGTNAFLLDGKPFQIRCGEIHAARVPREFWQQRLRMCRAMGLNAVCAYLFWNQIEAEPGHFDWSGQADIAEFCRVAQQEGLWVILRPGPYSCAEWEMGGLPWWLLKQDGIQLRSRDPRFVDAAKKYFKEVGAKLGPRQITHGGPIILVQVENEYGSFGKDAQYIKILSDELRKDGFDVPLFQCNSANDMKNGLVPGLFQAVNFGSDPETNFRALRKLQSNGPLFCSEFYPGWFDTWGQPHHYGNTPKYLADLKYMLDVGASFSIYMAHGGTTFGLWSGCDRPFKPDTSSYDYDAPISEAGWTTEKFFKTRELFSKYLQPGETLPDVPAQNSAVSFARVELNDVAPVFDNLPEFVTDSTPHPMETYDEGFGCILYRTTVPAGPATALTPAAIHDFGYVFLNGKSVGVLDRRSARPNVTLPARQQPAQLDILVEPMGRVNFGKEISDHKGLMGPVKAGDESLKNWKVFRLPLDGPTSGHLHFTSATSKLHAPAFWRGHFNLTTAADTFIDLRTWGKGVLWINGRCLGRYWNIGPTQTAYAPGCWLRAGANEIVILDLLGPEVPRVAGLEKPILAQLRLTKDFTQSRRQTGKLNLNAITPVVEGQFAPGADAQEVKFRHPVTGRYFCLESLSAFDGQPYAAIAELDLIGTDGESISHNSWSIAYVDSEEKAKEDGSAENAIDGQRASFWHTEWSAHQPKHPHQFVIDLKHPKTIAGFRYIPRQGPGGGRIKDYRIYIGDHLIKN